MPSSEVSRAYGRKNATARKISQVKPWPPCAATDPIVSRPTIVQMRKKKTSKRPKWRRSFADSSAAASVTISTGAEVADIGANYRFPRSARLNLCGGVRNVAQHDSRGSRRRLGCGRGRSPSQARRRSRSRPRWGRRTRNCSTGGAWLRRWRSSRPGPARTARRRRDRLGCGGADGACRTSLRAARAAATGHTGGCALTGSGGRRQAARHTRDASPPRRCTEVC